MPKSVLITLSIIGILLIIIIIASTIASLVFEQTAKKEVTQLLDGIPEQNSETVEEIDLDGLPGPVQRWLKSSNMVGKEKITSVRLKQKGQMRTAVDGPWMETTAEQYFRVDEPGFIWKASVKMAPLVNLAGMDRYSDGKGRMSIKLLSLLPVVDSEGPEIDQGTLLRYLAEMQWFPSAALNPYIKWEPVDETSAKATMTYKGVSASGVFTFNENGDVVEFWAKRYREVDGEFVLTDWGGVSKDYKEFDGIRIPSKSEIIWRDETGDFNWFECEITEIEYNKAEMYES